MSLSLVLICSFGYLLVLFGIAYWAERRLKKGKSLLTNPYIYALSMAVYCTAWTFYGSIGRAVEFGPDFLAIYIGPTLISPLWFVILRKMVRICKTQRITSIADFISSRYGKNTSLGTLVTVVCVLGLLPYIALQIKAIAITFKFLIQAPTFSTSENLWQASFFDGTPFWITVLLAIFIIIFGTRKIDSTERHEGMVTAIAFESIIKLVAFLAGGIFIVFYLFDGLGDIFKQASAEPALKNMFVLNSNVGYADWFAMGLLSMFAILLLPRQFQVGVVENVNEQHINKAVWLFPLYLLIINILVLPIAFAGQLYFPNNAIASDFSILSLPFANQNIALTLLIYIGGFSAATGMIIVETIALSTMLSNNLLMPLILKVSILKHYFIQNVERSIKFIRRFAIVLILILAYTYFAEVAEGYSLVSTGLISFAAVAQFGPAVLGGMFWQRGNKNGALLGITGGFIIWFYTLIIPAIVGAGLLPQEILSQGPFGIELLKPYQLLGLIEFSPLTHSFFWSMLANFSLYTFGSIYTSASSQEKIQAELFINVFQYNSAYESSVSRTGKIKVSELKYLLNQFLGAHRVQSIIESFNKRYHVDITHDEFTDQRLLTYSEKILSGVIGSASARILIESIVKEEEISLTEVVEILKESQQLISLNKELQYKSEELKKASDALALANLKMKEADVVKDEFLYTVTHELRTPLTSIRAFSEILFDNPDLEETQRQEFLGTMIKEIERLSRLITQVLDLERLESGKQDINYQKLKVNDLISDAVTPLTQLIKDNNIKLDFKAQTPDVFIEGDKDLLIRVIQNLASNAIKYTDKTFGEITINTVVVKDKLQINILDNGEGIETQYHDHVFNKFFQVNHNRKQMEGSGLGLTICKRIINMHQGEIWVENNNGKGACFSFVLPILKR